MRISYPEAERMGWNYEDVYLFAFSELDYLTTELQKLYNNDGINDIPSYVLRLVKKMLALIPQHFSLTLFIIS